MKKILLASVLACFALTACNEWDDHYNENTPGGIGENTEELDITMTEFFAEKSDYSAFFDMLKAVGLDKQLERDQQLTLWVADNKDINASRSEIDTLTMSYHITNLSFSENELKNGMRLLTLSGIYVQIARDEDNSVLVNDSKVLKSFQLKNGVVHVIDEMLVPRVSMYDYLKNLNDDYSIIRDSIFQYNERAFDRDNSRPIGVDQTGNTIYDSVFYIKNDFIDNIGIKSEFNQYTVFVPNNNAMNQCFAELEATYKGIGRVYDEEAKAAAMDWIRSAIFFNGTTAGKTSEVDITSVSYSLPITAGTQRGKKQWRTTVQKIDRENPYILSNGEAYEVTYLKVPLSSYITRIKSLVHYWDYLPESEKYTTYTFKGLKAATLFTSSATPNPNVLPNYIVLNVTSDAPDNEEFSVEFPPLEMYTEDGLIKARQMQVPVGEYDLYMGFHSDKHPYVNAYFNGKLYYQKIKVTDSNPWNFDRVTETTDGISKWNGLGGKIGTVTVEPSEEGSLLGSFRIKIEFAELNGGTSKQLRIYHWALKPTANNY